MSKLAIFKWNFLLCILIFSSFNSFAVISMTITQGNAEPIPLAVNNFAGVDAGETDIANEIVSVIASDLKNSGIFRPISRAAFIERKIGTAHTPLFAAWQQINANLLINGEVKRLSSGKLQVKFILWDVTLEREMVKETFELSETISRRVGHKIADRVYQKITGFDGYFDSRIVYVAESGPYLKRIKRIAIMDQDGENHQYLTDGSDLVLTPRFSPDGNKILYLSYKNDKPQVYFLDLRHGKGHLIGHFPGMSFAPRFSPDGECAIMSIAKGGSTHIYEINLSTKRLTQLTRGSNINTSPSYSPDGKRLVFNSDRDGSRQLFIMNRDGSNQHRITFGGGTYAEPNWSSKNYIAFTKINRTLGFTIGVLHPDVAEDSNTERLIANGYLVESPAWAANGRVIAFTKGAPPRSKNPVGLNRIHTIDFTGYNERVLQTPKDASDPDWSKLRL